MGEAPRSAYCISCGEEVPVQVVSIGIEGEELLQCVHCHSFLGTASRPQTLSSPARPPRPGSMPMQPPGDFRPDENTQGHVIVPEVPSGLSVAEAVSFAREEEEKPQPPLKTVITVEDVSLISTILSDLLVAEGLTERVIACQNGFDFLSRYVRARRAGVNIGLVVMDVKMPILNGISAAVAMRAYEHGVGLEEVPILYFTSKRCDETLRKVLLHTAPAMYINKGTSESPAHLQDRIRKVVRQLLREEW